MISFARAWVRHFSWRRDLLRLWVRNDVRVNGVLVMSQLTVIRVFGWDVRLHYFHADDQSGLHSHPRGFVSLCLRGSYCETMEDASRRFVWPGILTCRPASHAHRVTPVVLPCITLAVTTPVVQHWERISL